MASEKDLLARLVDTTNRVLERPTAVTPPKPDEVAAAEEEARRLAALRNPPRGR